MLKSKFVFLILMIFAGSVYSQQNEIDSIISKYTHNRCDTLLLKEICRYDTPDIVQSNLKTKICYRYSIFTPEVINVFILQKKDEIKCIIIENPSNIIFDLKFDGLTNLKSLILFGNDSDDLESLPEEVFNIESLEEISLGNVFIESQKTDVYKKNFPKIKITE